jgi:hypothetical protein
VSVTTIPQASRAGAFSRPRASRVSSVRVPRLAYPDRLLRRDSRARITAVTPSNCMERTAAVSRPKVLYSTKITRVKASKCMIAGVPKSERV